MRGPRVLATVALTLGLGPVGARAQGGDIESLLSQTVVTTPSKSAQAGSVAPATTSVITAEDLHRFGIRSLDEAVSTLALGMVTTSAQHAVEIGGRGVLLTGDYGNHVLLLVDGHTLNEPWNGTAYFELGAGIPFELVDHIEVTLGPGSVLYGSQAMLGVINIVTKRAKDYGGLHVLAEGEGAAGSDAAGRISFDGPGAGYRLGAGYGAEDVWLGEPVSGTIALEYYRQEGPDFGYAPQQVAPDATTGQPVSFGPRARPGVWGGTVRDSYFTEVPAAYGRFFVGDFEVLGRAGMYLRGTPYLDSIISGFGDFDEPDSRERDRWANAEVRHSAVLSLRATLRSRLYADLNEYRWDNVSSAAQDCPAGSPTGCKRTLVGTGRTLGGETSTTLDWFGDERMSTLVGLDAKIRDVEMSTVVSDRITLDALTPEERSHRTDAAIAAYVEQTAAPARWLSLNAGARYDHDPRFGGEISPRGAAGASAWPGGQIKLLYSQAFRAPTGYELEYHDPADTLAAPDLQPERTRSVELSVEERFGAQRLLVGVFRTWWDDMVLQALVSDDALNDGIATGQLDPSVTEAYRYANVSRIDNWGWNASWDGTALSRRLHYGLNVTEAHSRRDPGDGTPVLPLTVGPHLFGNARVAYDLPSGLPTVGLSAQYQARRAADRAFDGGFSRAPEAPAFLQLRGTLSGPVPRVVGLSYRVSVAYSFSSHGPYVVGPLLYAEDSTTRAALSPITRLSGFAGLAYRLDP